MSLPVLYEENIILQIIYRLQSIVAGEDYFYGDYTVDDNRFTAYEPDELPAINILDTTIEPMEISETSGNYVFLSQSIELHLHAANDDTLYIRRMIADIEKAIGQDTTWSGYAFDTDLVRIEKSPVDQNGNRIAHAIINLNIQYRKKKWSLT